MLGADPNADGTGRATLHLAEGRYHQVRRMFKELGGEVLALHRDRIGALELPGDLAAGALSRDARPTERRAMMRDMLDEESAGDAEEVEDQEVAPADPPRLSMRELLAQRNPRPRPPHQRGPGTVPGPWTQARSLVGGEKRS